MANTMEGLEEEHEVARSRLMRSAYIKWRMADLPSVYTDLMPPTYNVKVLWEAERAIRYQVAADQRHLANPWRQIGQEPELLDYEDLTADEKITFGLEVSIPVGLKDAPKRGRESEVADEVARQRAASPEYAAVMGLASPAGPTDDDGDD